jgi:hypothetical protein
MNEGLIFAKKQFGIGLIDLAQHLRKYPEEKGGLSFKLAVAPG